MKEKKKAEEMVVYRCPNCGSVNLKSLIDLRNNDTWLCMICDKEMTTA